MRALGRRGDEPLSAVQARFTMLLAKAAVADKEAPFTDASDAPASATPAALAAQADEAVGDASESDEFMDASFQ